jgi:hypothetical protein
MKKAVLLLLITLVTALPGQCEEKPKPAEAAKQTPVLRKPEEYFFNGAHQPIPAQDLLDQTLDLETAGEFKTADRNLTDVLSQVEKQPPSWWIVYYERAKCREHFDLSGAIQDLLQAAIFLQVEAEHQAKKDMVAAVKSYSKIIGFYERANVLHEQEKAWAGRGVDLIHDTKYIREAVMIYDGAGKSYQRQADFYLASHHRDYYTADMAKAQQFKAKAVAMAKEAP